MSQSIGQLFNRVDNVMVERLWRSVKYEEVYLKAYSMQKLEKQEICVLKLGELFEIIRGLLMSPPHEEIRQVS